MDGGDLLLLRRAVSETRPYRWHIGGVLLLSFLSTPLTLLSPIPLAIAVDGVLQGKALPAALAWLIPDVFEQSPDRLLVVAAVFEVLVVLADQLQSVSTRVLQLSVGEKITLRFRSRLLEHAQRLSFTFHDKRGTSDSIYRIQNDAAAIQDISVGSLIPLASALVTLVSMIVVTLSINTQLGIVALTITPLLYLLASAYRKKMRPKYRKVKELETSALKVVQEVLTSFRVVKAFGREDHEERRFRDQSAQGMRQRIRVALAENAFGLLLSMTTAIGTALVIYFGVNAVRRTEITLGELLVVLGYTAALYGPLYTITKRVTGLQSSLASAERAFELLDQSPDVAELPHAVRLERATGGLEFRNVSFAYPGEPMVLREISFLVDPGATLGILGPTGAGKTTLVSLLTRFYDPSAGTILLDGRDIREYKLGDLRRQFAIMLQEPVLFSTTIRDNIAYADPNANQQEIETAARAAGAHDFIVALPDGYDTVVGERGMRLSGGERQRISLARAFLRDAPILVLDEPTSSVDVGTEGAIMEAMARLMKGRTTLMIAHRLTTLAGCDQLLEIRQGRAVPRESLAIAGDKADRARVTPNRP